jgi:hypothetical protein
MKTLLYLAVAGQLGILIASALVPRVLNWRDNLATLNPFLRRLFWVYGSFIVLTIIGCSMLTFVNAAAMAEGDPVGRSICIFIAVFWAARLFVQFAVFDARPFLTNWFYKAGYHALTVVFVVLVAIYAMAAFFPGSALVSSAGDRVSRSRTFKDCSGETPKPTRETRVLPGIGRPAAVAGFNVESRRLP